MSARPKFINAIMPPVESGGTLSQHETLVQRITTLRNTRERVHFALPIEQQFFNQFSTTVAEQAGSILQHSKTVELLPEIANSPDLVALARQQQAEQYQQQAREAVAEALEDKPTILSDEDALEEYTKHIEYLQSDDRSKDDYELSA